MGWKRRIGTAAAIAALVIGTALPALADPPNVAGTVDETGVEINCGTDTIERDRHGWWGLIQSVDDVSQYHISIVYTNSEGEAWKYMDTGLIRWHDAQGDSYVSLSGRSTNVGPEGTGWVGRWVFNLDSGEVESLVGNPQGDVDQAACDALTA